MRQKKTKFIYYVIGALLIVAFVYIATQKIPLHTEHVEEVISNAFLSK